MSNNKPPLIFRFICFALLAFFALIPMYIVIGFLISVATSEDSFSLAGLSVQNLKDLAIVLAIICFSVFLTYILWLLAYRALTWSSSREDGHLLPPIMMKLSFAMIGALGLGVLVYSLYQGEYAITLGGLLYIITAFVANRRFRNA